MKHVVLSLGMGVESVAIFLRWIYEPQTRPCTLENIMVITSQTGDEFPDTARDMTNHILPLMREHRIRYVQVARHGAKEADGITVLSDTRSPEVLFINGDYKLSDELAASGVVPSYAGAYESPFSFVAMNRGMSENGSIFPSPYSLSMAQCSVRGACDPSAIPKTAIFLL